MTEQVGWVETRSGSLFVGWHTPQGPPSATAVVLVPPFGWEGICAGRNLRGWARQLAAAGHPTLRYHPPGAGDSSGTAVEQDLTSWSAALADLVAHAHRAAGARRVCVIGLGMGGLVALQAVADGAAIDNLVLWAGSGRGRVLMRELRAFAALAGDPRGPSAEHSRTADPVTDDDGVLWVHGYPLSARAQEQLTALDAADLDVSRLRRVLLLGRGTLPPDRKLAESLSAAGVDVTAQPGPGYDELTVEPRLSQAPTAVMAVVGGWLRQDPSPEARPVAALPWGQGGDERLLQIGETAAVLTDAAGSSLTAVFLSAGVIPRSGPNRLWTDTGRRWADRGVASVRVDLPRIGEAEGPDAFSGGPESLYAPGTADHISRALDAVVEAGAPGRFLVVGMCSGGFWAVDTALRDDRVVGVASLNGSLLWPPPLSHVSKRTFVSRHTARRLLHDRAMRRELGVWSRAQLARTRARLRPDDRSRPTTPAQVAGALQERGVVLGLAASTGEPVLLQHPGLPLSPLLLARELEGPVGAHTLATPGLLRQAVQFLDETLDLVLDRSRVAVT